MWQMSTQKQDTQCRYNVTLRHVRITIPAVGGKKSIIHSECVFVALVIQHAKRMPRIVICDLSGRTVTF